MKNPMDLLNEEQARIVVQAQENGIPILIDGDRNRPTGKSTLCQWLRTRGAEAYEMWELEEGEAALNEAPGENAVVVVARLNKRIF